MKALTLWEPWATLLALGYKQFETRPWQSAHRGELAIHAAATKKHCKYENVISLCKRGGLALEDIHKVIEAMKPGHILAVVRVGDIVSSNGLVDSGRISPQEEAFGDYGPDRFAWPLHDLQRLAKPVPAKGMQQFWYPPAEILAAVRAQLRGAA